MWLKANPILSSFLTNEMSVHKETKKSHNNSRRDIHGRSFDRLKEGSRVVTIFIYSLVFFFSCFLDFVNNASLCCFIALRFNSL